MASWLGAWLRRGLRVILDSMQIPLSHDRDGAFLMVAPESLNEVAAALALAGLRFDEANPDGAGCAGPVVGVLRMRDLDAGQEELQERIDRALEAL